MPTPENDIEIQLARELKTLHAYTARSQASAGEERFEKFDQPIDKFDMRWQEQLKTLELHELRGGRTTANQLADQPELEASSARNLRDAIAIKRLDPDAQARVWSAENRVGLSPLTTNDRNDTANDIYEKGRSVIQERYANLQEMLRTGVADVRAAKEPDLAPFIAQQIELKQEQQKIFTASH